jgi:Domain of unknown function (DUF1905)/Bacteriocin-protection, YdeI or OmpD-Associated
VGSSSIRLLTAKSIENDKAFYRVFTVLREKHRFGSRLEYHARVEDSLHVFSGRIYKVGLIRYVDVPAEITRKMSAREAHVPVRGTVEGIALRTTMVSRGRGCHRIAIHGDIRKKLRIDAGGVVEIAIERDEEPREPILPPFLVLSLRNAPKAQAAFRSMTTALRRQIVRYLTSVKQQGTLERRITKFVRLLEDRARQRRPKQPKRRPTPKRK